MTEGLLPGLEFVACAHVGRLRLGCACLNSILIVVPRSELSNSDDYKCLLSTL